MRHAPEEGMELNLTPMIDIVFQLVIFFILNVAMQDTNVDDSIRLAMAPHAVAVEKKDPREIPVDVDARGRILIARAPLTEGTLRAVLKKAVAQYGQTTPVIIRGDGKTQHENIKRVMDACKYAGLWKVKFAAFKEAP